MIPAPVTAAPQSITSAVPSSVPRRAILACGLFLAVTVGCERSDVARKVDQGPDNSPANQRAARELLNAVKSAYSQATQYHDDAKIVVRYHLNGRPMEEHQLWAVDFQRPNQLAARLFNARIQSDDRRTTAMVFDFDSENMDGQYLVLDGSQGTPWEAMFADPVCRHFISGSTEIPFNARLGDELILPPTIGLLFSRPAVDWLEHPDQVELLDDGMFDGKTVRRIRVAQDRYSFELWIDPPSKLVMQIILPNSYLDDALLSSPEIANLQLSARFHGATFEPVWTELPFSTELPDLANPVSRFVPLPEPFPSEAVGKSLPALLLTDANGKPDRWTPPTRATVLAWVDRQDSSLELIRQLEAASATAADSPLAVQLCFVEFRDPSAPATSGDLPQFIHDAKIQFPILRDVNLAAGAPLGIKFAPTVIVLDPAGKVQFFYSIGSSDWKTKLSAALERVRKGEDVAREMRAEYSRFIDEYKTKLRRLNPLTETPVTPAKNVEFHAGNPTEAKRTPTWTTTELKLPGNIVSPDSDRVLINEGWQSVAEVNLTSQLVGQRALDLDPEMSVTTLRAANSSRGGLIGAFAEMGRQSLVVDDHWNTLGKRTSDSGTQFRDLQISRKESDDELEVWILDSTGHLACFDRALTNKSHEIQIESADSFVVVAPEGETSQSDEELQTCPFRFLVVRSDGGIVAVDKSLRPQPAFAFGSLKVRQLHASPTPDLLAGATALNERGEWVAMGINRNLEVAWTAPISPQEFERQIQPITAMALDARSSVWAVAASDGVITILSHNGQELDSFRWPDPIHGLALVQVGGATSIAISDPRAVSICDLHLTSPASASETSKAPSGPSQR